MSETPAGRAAGVPGSADSSLTVSVASERGVARRWELPLPSPPTLPCFADADADSECGSGWAACATPAVVGQVFSMSTLATTARASMVSRAWLRARGAVYSMSEKLRHHMFGPTATEAELLEVASDAALARLSRCTLKSYYVFIANYELGIWLQDVVSKGACRLVVRNAVDAPHEPHDAYCSICCREGSCQKELWLSTSCEPVAHTFHLGCLMAWVRRRHRDCPMCRSALPLDLRRYRFAT